MRTKWSRRKEPSHMCRAPAKAMVSYDRWSRQFARRGLSHASTFLHPFAPPALPGFHATMGALTPGRSALRILIRDNELRPYVRPGLLVSCIKSSRRSVSNHKMPPLAWSGFFPGHYRGDRSPPFRVFGVLGFTITRRLATTSRRIEFVILRTSSSSPVALHPLSRGRSYFQLRSSNQLRQGLSPCKFDTLTSARV